MLAEVKETTTNTANTMDYKNNPILIREEVLLDFTERLMKDEILLDLNGLIES
jgi:hypothetical protein